MEKYQTEQEKFWTGDFGNSYIERNQGQAIVACNTALFGKILARTVGVNSVIELGANVGLNLLAMRNLLPEISLSAIEINAKAVEQLKKIENIEIHPCSILDFKPVRQYDLAIIKTVLIHIDPDFLPKVYQTLYEASTRYICLAEYYNPSPVEVNYRGHEGKLFKRDFAGEMLDQFADLQLLDYGFIYHRDSNFRQDDLNWFLMEKR